MATEQVYINSYSEVNREWTENGSTPYLSNDNDIIYTDLDEYLHDEFGFADPVNIDDILESVVIWFEVSGPSARNDQFVPYIHDGSSWQLLTFIDPDTNGYAWYNQDISSILDTWTKITNAKLRCRYNRSGSPSTQIIYIRRAYLLITYTEAAAEADEIISKLNENINQMINNGLN